MSQASSLVSTQNHVESPFIIVRVGEYTFGHCEKTKRSRLQTTFKVTYPNYLEQLNVTKVNGAINTYNIQMKYTITQEDDPNRLEKVFSSISSSRMIYLSYGDWESPAFIYKEEEAIITKLTTRVNLESSSITYNIQCTSNALTLTAQTRSFAAKTVKPSSEIIRLLKDKSAGLTDVFKGMKNISDVKLATLIARDDKEVKLEAKKDISVIDYISYLVSCMIFKGDQSKELKTSCYFWSVYDDTSNTYGGTYFKVIRVPVNANTLVSYNTYEVDVGFPTANCVTSFNVNNDDSWSLLYNYSKKVDIPEYIYTVDNKGNLLKEDVSLATKSKTTGLNSETTRNWWSLVTQFPITASLTIKGLLRPAMLMQYVKVNTYFYGRKHISSGLYIITKQEDVINSSGYKTTLTLTRVGGDEHYV